MAIGSNEQVQNFSDQRVRPRSEAFRALLLACQDDKSAIDDVYAACAQPTPTWTDGRTDGVPHLAVPADILAYNELITSLLAWAAAESNYAVVQKLCVRPVSG